MRTTTLLKFVFGLVLFVTGTLTCSAAAVTYSVNRTVGGGTVNGTIQTDGTVGTLTAANILDWNLLLYDGTNTFRLTGPLSGNNSHVFIVGTDATASASQLSFNFSGVDNGYLLFQVVFSSGTQYYCDATATAGVCSPGESVVPATLATSQRVPVSGNVGIGNVTTASPTPVPTSWMLLAAGLLALLLVPAVRNRITGTAA